MKFFLDTEFIERGSQYPIQLVSIGIVCENGSEFYAVSEDYDPNTANDWVKANVFPHLHATPVPLKYIATQIVTFVTINSEGQKPEFWGYYADYDWVVLCQMFGTMMDLPKGWPMYCRDIKQWCDMLGNPELPKQVSTEHNAREDARWNKLAFEFLEGVRR